jgi:hypothetical protein
MVANLGVRRSRSRQVVWHVVCSVGVTAPTSRDFSACPIHETDHAGPRPAGKLFPAIYNVLPRAGERCRCGRMRRPGTRPTPQATMRRHNTTILETIVSVGDRPPLAACRRTCGLPRYYEISSGRESDCQRMAEPSACRRDFDDLVYDKRGTRRDFTGFTPVLALRDFYYGYDPWLGLVRRIRNRSSGRNRPSRAPARTGGSCDPCVAPSRAPACPVGDQLSEFARTTGWPPPAPSRY